MRLVLASASPRRQALMGLLGLDWRAAPAAVDEAAHLAEDPQVSALSVAVAKLRALAPPAPDEITLAADTLVVLEGRVLGKPADLLEATSMLRSLRARDHHVLTGVAMSRVGHSWAAVVATRVVMRNYADAEVEAYVARGEPFDKAGGYAVQDKTFTPVEQLDGCYLNVVGLPLCAVAAGLRTLGVSIAPADPPPCDYCRAGASLVAIP